MPVLEYNIKHTSTESRVLDEGVVSGDLVILEPGLHPLLEVGDVDGALLVAHVATDKQRELLRDDVGKVNKRWPVSRIT